MSYNGWKNYQTWNVALWFGNDEGLYDTVRDYKRRFKKFNKDSAKEFVKDLLLNRTPDLKGDNPYKGVDRSSISRLFNEM